MKLIKGVACWFNPARVKKFYIRSNRDVSTLSDDGLTETRPYTLTVYADEIALKCFKYEVRYVGTVTKGRFGDKIVSWSLAADCDEDELKNETRRKAWAWLDKFVAELNAEGTENARQPVEENPA